MAKKTYIVTHPKFFSNTGGKMAHIAQGTEVERDEKAAEMLVAKGKLQLKTAAKKA